MKIKYQPSGINNFHNSQMRSMKLIKLTDKNNTTHNILEWGKNVTHSVPKSKKHQLCSSDVIHAYKSLNLALLINPIGANYDPFRIWEAKGDMVVSDWGKVGCFELTTIKELKIPKWFSDKKVLRMVQVQFAILCAEKVISNYESKYPADDRPRKSIEAAKEYLKNPSNAARAAYADAAADAAARADDAAYAAAYAARAANAAARAANAAARAADAAYAAAYAARAAAEIDFCKIADHAVQLWMP